MSYIDLINQFWRMNRVEQFTPTEVCLYFYLLSQWNNSDRESSFEIKSSVMFAELKMSKPTIYEVRERLKERGLIDFTEGERRSSAPVYRIMENVEVGRQKKVRIIEVKTEEPEVFDDIPIPDDFQWGEEQEEVIPPPEPVRQTKPRGKVEKPLGELFKPEKPKKREKQEFIPPPLQEVEDFFSGLGILNAEERAQQFFFHYDSLGWHTATGAAVHRWDSLANKWLLNDKQKEQQNENSRSSSKKSGEGDGYKQSLINRFAESERKFREKHGDS